MGNTDSKTNIQESIQKVTNKIVQSSEQHCINVCIVSTQVNLQIINSIVGRVDVKQFCFINGVSCVLKASLQTELINSLESNQAMIEKIFSSIDFSDPLGFGKGMEAISKMFPYGALTDIAKTLTPTNKSELKHQFNYQALVNAVTQSLNSSCENKASTGAAPINLDIINSTVGHVNIETGLEISNTDCYIENAAKTFVKNDVKNTQDNTLEDGTDIMGIISVIMAVIIISVIAKLLLNHHKKDKDKDKDKHELTEIPKINNNNDTEKDNNNNTNDSDNDN